MHKRTIEVLRLLFPVLLTLLLLVPLPASAAGLSTGQPGPEQPEAPFEPSDIPSVGDIPEIGYVYTVVAGDDVWLIAIAHGISMEALVAANNLESPYWLHPGDRLFVPAEPAIVEHPAPPQPETPDPQPVAAPDPVVATATASETTEPAVQASAATPAAMPDGAALIFRLINERRTDFGLPALSWSTELAQAAHDHAVDCAQRGWGSHVGSDGARLRTRLSQAGYTASWASENWANSRSAQNAFEMWWYEGPGGPHYENILGSNYSEIGIALVDGGWGYYVVADFGSR